MFRNIANQNPEYVNVGLCGSYLHQTTSNAPNAINQKCLIISALAVGIIILRSLLPLENKVYHAKTKNSFKRVLCFYMLKVVASRMKSIIWLVSNRQVYFLKSVLR